MAEKALAIELAAAEVIGGLVRCIQREPPAPPEAARSARSTPSAAQAVARINAAKRAN